MVCADQAGTVPDLAADQSEQGVAGGVDRDHHMRQHASGMAIERAEAAAAPGARGELDLTRILDRQDVRAGHRRAGQRAPACDDFLRRHLGTGEKPASAFLAGTITAELAQTDGFARDHLFKDESPPLLRRSSPNDPADHSMLAYLLRFTGGSESDRIQARQVVLSFDSEAI
jgi:hypothetical protein